MINLRLCLSPSLCLPLVQAPPASLYPFLLLISYLTSSLLLCSRLQNIMGLQFTALKISPLIATHILTHTQTHTNKKHSQRDHSSVCENKKSHLSFVCLPLFFSPAIHIKHWLGSLAAQTKEAALAGLCRPATGSLTAEGKHHSLIRP
jgi:hypothetical protein